MSNTYSIHGNAIQLSSGQRLSFDYPIAQTENAGEIIVIRLDVPRGSKYNENVFGVSSQGELLWQVQEKKYTESDSPYVDIRVR